MAAKIMSYSNLLIIYDISIYQKKIFLKMQKY